MALRAARATAKRARPSSAVALDGLDDIQEGDAVGRPREPIAAGPPGQRLHEPGPMEIAKHLWQEPHRDRHRVRDPSRGQQPALVATRKGDHRSNGVVAPLRELESHVPEYLATGRLAPDRETGRRKCGSAETT